MHLTDSFIVNSTVIEIALADITTAEVEVVVNSICNLLHFGNGVSGTFVKKGGLELVQETILIGQSRNIEPGDVIVTSAGRMPIQHVFHAISSVCGQGSTARILRNCIINCLAEAKALSVRSIAFPALGTGEMGFDIREAAAVLIDTVVEECTAKPGLDRIVFCLLKPNAFTTFFRQAVRRSVELELSTRNSDRKGYQNSGNPDDTGLNPIFSQCPKGRKFAAEYTRVAKEVISNMFVPPLSPPLPLEANQGQSMISKVVFPNYAEDGFWYLLNQRFGASMIGAVFTNEDKTKFSVAIEHMVQLLQSGSWSQIGLVVGRNTDLRGPSQAQLNAYREHGLIILALDDFDLSQMLKLKRLKQKPETYLEAKIGALTLADSKSDEQVNKLQEFSARKIFVSYAHEDTNHRRCFERSLRLMYLQGLIEFWSDVEILPGSSWEAEIKKQIDEADIITCMVSPDFIASDFCFCDELELALKKQKGGCAHIVPLVIRPCEWDMTPLAKLQAIPTDSNGSLVPVSQWDDPDVAWLEVSRQFRKLIQKTHQGMQ